MLNRSKRFKYKIASYKEDLPKPKKNEIVIIPRDNRMMEIAPYKWGEKLPDWWKTLPTNKGSLRRCSGTYDFLSTGIIIPLWCDVTIRPSVDGIGFDLKTNDYSDEIKFTIEHFSGESTGECPMKMVRKKQEAFFPKLVSPWRLFTPKGVSLISLPALHEPSPNYTIMPGIVHTDFYDQIHVVLSVMTDKEFTIPAGTPIMHLIPFHRGFDIKKIVFGNESMFRFVIGTNMGKGSLSIEDKASHYKALQRSNDQEAEQKLNKKWYSFLKK